MGKLLPCAAEPLFSRVGGNEPIQVDIRVIAATNCDLKRWCSRNASGGPVLPAECHADPYSAAPEAKKNDIIPLAQHFLDYYNQKNDFHRKLSPATCFALLNYRWKGTSAS